MDAYNKKIQHKLHGRAGVYRGCCKVQPSAAEGEMFLFFLPKTCGDQHEVDENCHGDSCRTKKSTNCHVILGFIVAVFLLTFLVEKQTKRLKKRTKLTSSSSKS